jgi:DNA-binding XRE family transcriptional regulator
MSGNLGPLATSLSVDDGVVEDRDHPLVLQYDVEPEWLKPLGLPPARPRLEQGRGQIAAIAIHKSWDPQAWISYSRNKNHYARRGTRYDERPDLYRHSIIPAAVDVLASAGFLESVIAPPDPNCGWQSVFRAMPALMLALGDRPPPAARPKRRALIQLRDEQKQLIDFRNTERTDRMRRHLVGINEAISSLGVELLPEIGERQGDLLRIGDTCLNLSNLALYRIFNSDFRYGGRFYGHWIQGLPKMLRKQLTINGQPVTEPDYEAHHPSILYALEALPLPGNPYDIDGWERTIVKRVLFILINALTPQSATGAIVYHLGLSRLDAARLVNELKRKHAPIAEHFHSGAGCWLQRLDSDIAERVLLGLVRQGVPVLPIHDSFIGLAKHESAVREQMAEEFETVISRARSVSRITRLHQQLKPKTTYTMVRIPALPSALSASSRPVAPSLHSSGVSAFFDAGRRITPLGRIATLQAQRRRDIRQDNLADLVGISRPTLANILAGRFGASHQSAVRIAEIIATTPAFERQPFLPGLAA